MHVAYYITDHGFGHALRSSLIAAEFAPSTAVTFVTTVPRSFFSEEVHRPFNYRPMKFDCGCLQRDGVTVDSRKTLSCYREIACKNRSVLKKEVNWCKSAGVDVIASDITPFAFEIARHAGVPSVAVTNFTWFDIYREYLETDPAFEPCLEEMRLHYASSTLLCALAPSLPMDYFPRRIDMPIVGRRGKKDSGLLASSYGIDSGKRIGIIYLGNFGLSGAVWKRIESFSSWQFLGIHPIPGDPVNFHLMDKGVLPYHDCVASADCVIGKLGYGTVTECMVNGTPLLYLPRERFAEYTFLDKAVEQWGGGVRINAERFTTIDWDLGLHSVLQVKPVAFTSNGAFLCARSIESLALSG